MLVVELSVDIFSIQSRGAVPTLLLANMPSLSRRKMFRVLFQGEFESFGKTTKWPEYKEGAHPLHPEWESDSTRMDCGLT